MALQTQPFFASGKVLNLSRSFPNLIGQLYWLVRIHSSLVLFIEKIHC